MDFSKYKLNDGQIVEIREALLEDAPKILNFIHKISIESDFLTFGRDEFDITTEEEGKFLQRICESENQIYLLATVKNTIIAILNFNAGQRPRIQHSGEFSMVVQKQFWGLGIGSHLMDTFIKWAKTTQIIKKINCRVRNDNYTAIKLYEGKGFLNEGTIRKGIFLKGKYYNLLWMGLEL